MSADRPEGGESFLGRWSRIKTETREAGPTPDAPAPAKVDDSPAPDLPPIDQLTLDSDFSGFFHPKVDENLRRSALRKLFSEPHFNVMDGLDTYIDDYSKTEPLPAAMLASLKQAQRILEWAAETEEQAQVRRAALSPEAAEAAPESLAPPADDTNPGSTVSAEELDPVPDSKA